MDDCTKGCRDSFSTPARVAKGVPSSFPPEAGVKIADQVEAQAHDIEPRRTSSSSKPAAESPPRIWSTVMARELPSTISKMWPPTALERATCQAARLSSRSRLAGTTSSSKRLPPGRGKVRPRGTLKAFCRRGVSAPRRGRPGGLQPRAAAAGRGGSGRRGGGVRDPRPPQEVGAGPHGERQGPAGGLLEDEKLARQLVVFLEGDAVEGGVEAGRHPEGEADPDVGAAVQPPEVVGGAVVDRLVETVGEEHLQPPRRAPGREWRR